MSFPQYPNKYQYASLVSARHTLEYLRKMGRVPDDPVPQKVILCYQGSFMDRLTKSHPGQWSTGIFKKLYWLKQFPGVAIGEFGIGAPQIVLKMELLIAWGVRSFISIGTAGAIASDLKIGDLVGCDRAIRDEGTSHHYIPHERYSYPTDQGLFARKFDRIGTTWTLDAFFRHTRKEVAHYQNEGVLTVEMEASALFTVSKFYNVSLGAGFVISDLMYGDEWEPQMHQSPVEEGLDRLLDLALL